MLGKLAADALGLSDIGKIIAPKDFDKVETDDYVLHEDGEKIFFLIKSKMDEYCFTNFGLVHLDGNSAISKKRMLRRYNYHKFPVRNVALETAGTVDLDIEIKFSLGDKDFSIDVTKSQLSELKIIYKILLKISSIQYEHSHNYEYAMNSLSLAKDAIGRTTLTGDIQDSFRRIYEFAFAESKAARDKYFQKDFTAVYEKYLGTMQK